MTKRIKPSEGNKTFCMAPWLHTYISPQMERRLCCSSRESASNFKQYIDTYDPKGYNDKINLTTLDKHWNSDYMKSVRVKLMAGEEIPQCAVCNHKLLNESVYRQHFNWLYRNKINEAFDSTNDTGATTMKVESFDYRFSNLCNFSCRMCGDMLSSTWEAENKKYGKGDYENYRIWGRKDIKEQLEKFHDQQVVKEFTEAVEEKRITELYWCGGEPLMWKIHWETMLRILELGYADKVLARYNSNMSRINFYGKNLFDDILQYYPKFQICASIDGTGEIGEYIRSGIKYDEWLKNIKYGIKFLDYGEKRMQLDLTITLPGLFDLENMVLLSNKLGLELLTKQVFNFDHTQSMSPLFMPYDIMAEILDDVKEKTIKYKSKNTEKFFRQLDEMQRQKRNNNLVFNKVKHLEGQKKGKERLEYLDRIRGTDIKKILGKNKKVLEWWTSI
jgi:organic radical activating enzyme